MLVLECFRSLSCLQDVRGIPRWLAWAAEGLLSTGKIWCMIVSEALRRPPSHKRWFWGIVRWGPTARPSRLGHPHPLPEGTLSYMLSRPCKIGISFNQLSASFTSDKRISRQLLAFRKDGVLLMWSTSLAMCPCPGPRGPLEAAPAPNPGNVSLSRFTLSLLCFLPLASVAFFSSHRTLCA